MPTLLVKVDGSTFAGAAVLDETPTNVRAPATKAASEIPHRQTLINPPRVPVPDVT
jgi:hypothetical protein